MADPPFKPTYEVNPWLSVSMYGDRNWGFGMITPIAQEHEEKRKSHIEADWRWLKYYPDDLKVLWFSISFVIFPHFPSDFGPQVSDDDW